LDIELQSRPDNNEDTAGNINNDSLVDADTQANVVPASTNREGLPEVEAYLVEDGGGEVYDATPLEPTLPWWKQRRTKILLGVVLVIVGTFAIALGVTLTQSNNTIFVTQTTFSIAPSSSIAPSTSPSTTTYECFDPDDGGRDGILGNAVRAYVLQDCPNNKDCLIGQTYGWPMNSWCVGNVKDMSSLFSNMDTFNEDINGWNTSSVTDMSDMFEYASSFNRNLSNFDTSSVTSMSWMFFGATSFNQDLCSWQDSFPYTWATTGGAFANSGCTYQDAPNESQNGPFCASYCQ